MEYILLLAMQLLLLHWLMDYPLQGWLAEAKLNGPLKRYHLIAHAGMHGCSVAWLLGNPWIGLAEWVLHAITDVLKCRNIISFQTDQTIHIVCKLIWLVIFITLQ